MVSSINPYNISRITGLFQDQKKQLPSDAAKLLDQLNLMVESYRVNMPHVVVTLSGPPYCFLTFL